MGAISRIHQTHGEENGAALYCEGNFVLTMEDDSMDDGLVSRTTGEVQQVQLQQLHQEGTCPTVFPFSFRALGVVIYIPHS